MQQKDELRSALLPRLAATAATERVASSQQVCARLLDQSVVSQAAALALYAAYDWELDLSTVVEAAFERGACVAFPRWTEEGYQMVPITSLADLAPGKYGICEPCKSLPAMRQHNTLTWIVPGLAFSGGGARLGRGAGHYDRMLANARGPRIAVCRDWQLQEELPQGSFDILMTHVATDKRWLTCQPTPTKKGHHI
ncbi:MAG: 5-formyltetrahydrofolate cyclo-ligase [Rhodothermales bacterium]|jgi:5-formyltetrahydrofolate cyclo-ligase